MLSRGDLTPLPPVATVQALAPLDRTADPRQDSMNRLLQIAIGQQVPATILSALEDGTYLVKLADTTARMALPAGSKAGDALQLTMAATSPRPTFLLYLDPESAPSTLSSTARLIDRLLQRSTVLGTQPVRGSTPLLDLSTVGKASGPGIPQAKEIAASLQNAISRSGLFYEAHLAQWANGRLDLADLQCEPQARLGLHLQHDPASGSLATEMQHSQIAAIVGAQLHALENQQIVWRGEAWPGQDVEWKVERGHDDDSQQEAPQTAWQTKVRFELPHLGAVTATIRLVGSQLQMRMGTDTPDTMVTLQRHADVLAGAMTAAGVRLDQLLISQQATDEA